MALTWACLLCRQAHSDLHFLYQFKISGVNNSTADESHSTLFPTHVHIYFTAFLQHHKNFPVVFPSNAKQQRNKVSSKGFYHFCQYWMTFLTINLILLYCKYRGEDLLWHKLRLHWKQPISHPATESLWAAKYYGLISCSRKRGKSCKHPCNSQLHHQKLTDVFEWGSRHRFGTSSLIKAGQALLTCTQVYANIIDDLSKIRSAYPYGHFLSLFSSPSISSYSNS